MSKLSFSIFLSYEGKSAIANVEELNSPLNFEYAVTFPDGTTKLFNTYETEDDAGWTENGYKTELAKEVGTAIEYYQKYGDECEPFKIKVADKDYIVSPCISLDGDTTTFKVYNSARNYLYELSLDEDGQWAAESTGENLVIDNDGKMLSLVEEFGKHIESKYS